MPESLETTLARVLDGIERCEARAFDLRFEAQLLGPAQGALVFKQLGELQATLNDFYKARTRLVSLMRKV